MSSSSENSTNVPTAAAHATPAVCASQDGAQGTYHRATQALLDGDLFYNSRRGNSNDLARRDLVYLDTYEEAVEWNYELPGWGWGPTDADAHLIRYMNAFARKIQRCWFNREEQPMACPCPESP